MLEKYKENMIKGIEKEVNNEYFKNFGDEECIVGLLTDIIRNNVTDEAFFAKSKLRPCLSLISINDKNLDYKLLIEKTENNKEPLDFVYYSIKTLAMMSGKNYKGAFINILFMLYSIGIDDNNLLFSSFEDNILEDYITTRIYNPNPYIEASVDSIISELINSKVFEDYKNISLKDKLKFIHIISSVSCAYIFTDKYTNEIKQINTSIIKDYLPLLTPKMNIMIEKGKLKRNKKGEYTVLYFFGRDLDISFYLYSYYFANEWISCNYPPTFDEFVENYLTSKKYAESLVGKII